MGQRNSHAVGLLTASHVRALPKTIPDHTARGHGSSASLPKRLSLPMHKCGFEISFYQRLLESSWCVRGQLVTQRGLHQSSHSNDTFPLMEKKVLAWSFQPEGGN